MTILLDFENMFRIMIYAAILQMDVAIVLAKKYYL